MFNNYKYYLNTIKAIGVLRFSRKPIDAIDNYIKYISAKYSLHNKKIISFNKEYSFKSNFAGKWFQFSKLSSCQILSNSEIKNVLKRANKARKGKFFVNGKIFNLKTDSNIINWNLDPESKKDWPIDNVFQKISYFPGDLRFNWELNRMHHIIWYSQAWKISNNNLWPKIIIEELEQLMSLSKFEYGIHWRDGLQIAIRIFSMIGAADICHEASLGFHRRITPIIKIHSFALSRQLSKVSEIKNNHAIGELCALALSGIYLDCPKYYSSSLKRLKKELDSQIYIDGIPYEGSIPYIRFILEFLILLYKAIQGSKYDEPEFLFKYIKKISISLSNLVSKSGLLPPIGDGDEGRVIKFDDEPYLNVNETLHASSIIIDRNLAPRKVTNLFCKSIFGKSRKGLKEIQTFEYMKSSGLIHLNYKDIDIWIDCGPTGLGIKGPGGHGHNDTTSIILYYKDKPILHDPGWYGYFIDNKLRDYFRSTFSHNVISIDGEEQARLGSKFEIINDCLPSEVRIKKNKKTIEIICGHNGFSRLKKNIIYTREIKFNLGSNFSMKVNDIVTSNKKVKVFSHLGSNYKWQKKKRNLFQINKFHLILEDGINNVDITDKTYSLGNKVLKNGSAINWEVLENNLDGKNSSYFSSWHLYK